MLSLRCCWQIACSSTAASASRKSGRVRSISGTSAIILSLACLAVLWEGTSKTSMVTCHEIPNYFPLCWHVVYILIYRSKLLRGGRPQHSSSARDVPVCFSYSFLAFCPSTSAVKSSYASCLHLLHNSSSSE